MEDTESLAGVLDAAVAGRVTVGSIRWRILKVVGEQVVAIRAAELQWARSDGGY